MPQKKTPSTKRIRELLRQGAELALRAPPAWLDAIDEETLSSPVIKAAIDDPVLSAALRRSNRANLLHWAASNVRDPGAPVPPAAGPDALRLARDLVRRGVDQSALDLYRTGQAAAWLRWMEIAFGLTNDPAELKALLELSARSISSFIDATIAAISEGIASERDALAGGTHAERREVVALILNGSPISPDVASSRLAYDLDRLHRAAVVWSDAPEANLATLEVAADALARACGADRPLTVSPSEATLWVWLPTKNEPDLDYLRTSLQKSAGLRVAVGTARRGVQGFRRSHLDAVTAQRMLARAGAEPRVATFDTIRLASLLTHDRERARDFLRDVLGDLENESHELRETLLVFLEEGCNATKTAVRLRVHRNTLLRRLERAESLLPQPLETSRVHVAAALEMMRYFGRRSERM